MKSTGRPMIPARERKSVTLQVRVRPHIGKTVKILAKREHVPVSIVLERALFAYLAGPLNASIAEAEDRQITRFEAGDIA